MRDVSTGYEEPDRLWNSPLGQYIRDKFSIEDNAIESAEWEMSTCSILLSGPARVDQWIVTLVHSYFTHPTESNAYWETPGATIHVHTTVMSVWTPFTHQVLSDATYTFPNFAV